MHHQPFLFSVHTSTGPFFAGLLETLQFTQTTLTPTQATQFLQQLANQPWLRKYKWGCSSTNQCPTAYVLLKQKKQFLAARPIINYRRFLFAKLLKATAIILQQLLQSCMPNTFGLQSLQQIFSNLQQFLTHIPPDAELTVHNQDLCWLFHFYSSTAHHALGTNTP